MQFGDDIIRKCPHCLKLNRERTPRFTGTIFFVLWSDGKYDGLTLHEEQYVVACPYCKEPFWNDEMEYIGRSTWQKDTPAEFREAFRVTPLSFKQYASMLEKGIREKEREKYVRLHLWWAGNDARRRETSKAPGLSVREGANIMALAELLDEFNAYELLLKAEVMRELGCFTDAQTLLNKLYGKEYQPFVEIISELVVKGDTRVRVLAEEGGFMELSVGMAVLQFWRSGRQVNFSLTPSN